MHESVAWTSVLLSRTVPNFLSHFWGALQSRRRRTPKFCKTTPCTRTSREIGSLSSAAQPQDSPASRHFGPGVAQADRAVEHEAARPGIRVTVEVALPLELHRRVGVVAGKARLEHGAGQHFER